MAYIPPPNHLPAFPDLRAVRRKTPVQGGGALRKRWKDQTGNIFEWDSRHGTLEKYDARGNHVGEFDSVSGEQIKPADPARSVQP